MMSFVERTAVKSAPKKPCSMPDQKVSGTIRSCFLRPSCLRILFSLLVLGTAKDCCVTRYLIVAERSLRPDICSLPSFNQILREFKVQVSFDRRPDNCLLREDLKMQQGEQQLRGSIPGRCLPEIFLIGLRVRHSIPGRCSHENCRLFSFVFPQRSFCQCQDQDHFGNDTHHHINLCPVRLKVPAHPWFRLVDGAQLVVVQHNIFAISILRAEV